MTKPQLSAEPSMEDILASIRKMISEERMGPRPIPDQMARTSYGESSPAARSAAPAASETRPDARTEARSERPEARPDPRPDARPETLPQRASAPADRPAPAAVDRFGRAPGDGGAARPTAERPGERTQPERSASERSGPERSPIDRGAGERPDRSGPSFSSLSDALKAAKSPAEQRRSLEEKIADMLESGPGAAAAGGSPSDPLAVFSGNRTMPAGASAAPARPAGASEAEAKPASSRAPGVSSNGATAPANLKPGDAATPVPPRDGAQAKPSSPAASASPSKPATSDPAAEKPGERIIAMPSRLPAASGAGQAGVASGTSPLNGAAAAAPGAAPFGVKQTPRPDTPAADKIADKTTVPAKDASPASKGPDTASIAGTPASSRPAAQTIGQPAGQAAGQAASQAAGHTAGPTSGPITGPITGLTPRPIPGEPRPQTPAYGPAQPHVRAPAARAGEQLVAREPATPSSETSKVESALADLLAQTQERAGISQQPPSEALIDAVVDLVHNEPTSLSVFTSGNAFIHGVGSHDEPADPAPVETQSTAPQAMNGAAAPKLDRNAAELLRPMLRQWLADNMPRIVEEALRSELMSSQAAPKDSDKA